MQSLILTNEAHAKVFESNTKTTTELQNQIRSLIAVRITAPVCTLWAATAALPTQMIHVDNLSLPYLNMLLCSP